MAVAEFKAGDEITMHEHKDVVEIFYVIQDELQLKSGSDVKILSANTTLMVYPNTSYEFKIVKPTRFLYFTFETNE